MTVESALKVACLEERLSGEAFDHPSPGSVGRGRDGTDSSRFEV